MIAHAFYHALVLRGADYLTDYFGIFDTYPETLRQRIIAANIAGVHHMVFHKPLVFLTSALSARGAYYDQNRRKRFSLDAIIDVLFAFNRLWLPDHKWLKPEFDRMPEKPDRILERLHEAVHTPGDAGTRIVLLLWRDVLLLLQSEFEVADVLDRLDWLLNLDLDTLINDPDVKNIVIRFHHSGE